jgi:cysteine-rich repeat protein
VLFGGLVTAPGGAVACGSSDGDTTSGTAGLAGAGAQAGAGGALTGGSGGAGGSSGADASSGGSGGSSDSGVAGAAGDAASDGDASTDGAAGGDGATDASVDAPVSTVCGDGIRDPVTEECDDGNAVNAGDSCSTDCRVQDVLFAAGPTSTLADDRSPGVGRHALAAGTSGFAVVFVEDSASPRAVRLRAFDPKGVPGNLVTVAQDGTLLANSDPVVAALPGGKYAVAYTDLHADGSSRGVALRIVDPAASSVGPLVRVNSPTLLNQSNADIVWTGTELVVAYQDETTTNTKIDARVARFAENGSPKGGAVALAATTDGESRLSLAPFAGGYAVAWVGAGLAKHTLNVQAAGVKWSLTLPSTTEQKSLPALAELDATRLLLVYATGGTSGTVGRLHAAVLDSSSPGPLVPFDIAPLVEPYASDASLGQIQPALARVGDRIYVAWKSTAVPSTVAETELWLKEMPWSTSAAGTLTFDLSKAEIALPRYVAHTKGRQELPALAAMPLPFGAALAAGWEDRGRVFGSIEGFPDVVAELMPLPIVRLPSEGGLE